MNRIYIWNKISDKYKDGVLLLGNGASIAIDEKFKYESIFKNTQKTEEIEQLFNFFKTNDFEFVLKLLWQTTNINNVLAIIDEKR